jgi:hypothetical protein
MTTLPWQSRLIESATQSVEDPAQVEQIGKPTQITGGGGVIRQRRIASAAVAPVTPPCRNERTAAIRQAHKQKQIAASSHAIDYRQGPAFEGVAFPSDRHRRRNIVVMSNLWWLLSTRFRMRTS